MFTDCGVTKEILDSCVSSRHDRRLGTLPPVPEQTRQRALLQLTEIYEAETARARKSARLDACAAGSLAALGAPRPTRYREVESRTDNAHAIPRHLGGPLGCAVDNPLLEAPHLAAVADLPDACCSRSYSRRCQAVLMGIQCTTLLWLKRAGG
jgi:hypothetical protein